MIIYKTRRRYIRDQIVAWCKLIFWMVAGFVIGAAISEAWWIWLR